jgi:hypothetical protein
MAWRPRRALALPRLQWYAGRRGKACLAQGLPRLFKAFLADQRIGQHDPDFLGKVRRRRGAEKVTRRFLGLGQLARCKQEVRKSYAEAWLLRKARHGSPGDFSALTKPAFTPKPA